MLLFVGPTYVFMKGIMRKEDEIRYFSMLLSMQWLGRAWRDLSIGYYRDCKPSCVTAKLKYSSSSGLELDHKSIQGRFPISYGHSLFF